MAIVKKSVASQVIPLANDHFVLPNTAVAEIIGYTKADSLPGAIKDAPDWLIGMLSWRGMSVPLLSFEALLGEKAVDPGTQARIAVINGIGEDTKVPFIAVTCQGIPRLVQIDESRISTVDDNAEANPAVLCHVVIDGEVAIIPDIENIETQVAEVFSGGLPIKKKARKKKD